MCVCVCGFLCACVSNSEWRIVWISVYSLHLLIACEIDCVASVIHHTLDSFDHLYISMHMHMRPFSDVHGSPFLSVPLSFNFLDLCTHLIRTWLPQQEKTLKTHWYPIMHMHSWSHYACVHISFWRSLTMQHERWRLLYMCECVCECVSVCVCVWERS